jgi:hypothetical protein
MAKCRCLCVSLAIPGYNGGAPSSMLQGYNDGAGFSGKYGLADEELHWVRPAGAKRGVEFAMVMLGDCFLLPRPAIGCR